MISPSFAELFKANFRTVYRNTAGLFWTIVLPVIIYAAVSLLPINRFVQIDVNYSTFLLPGLIALVIMQSGIYTLAYWLVELRARGVITRFLVTPLNAVELILSVISARTLVMIIQAALLTAVGIIFFNAPLVGNVFYALMFVVLGGFTFLLLGLLISTFGESYESTAPITAAIGLPLTFLSSVFYPLNALPEVLSTIASILPITHLADGLRKIYLEDTNLLRLWPHLTIILGWLITMLLVVLLRLKRAIK